jgi:outer membrane protein TolC
MKTAWRTALLVAVTVTAAAAADDVPQPLSLPEAVAFALRKSPDVGAVRERLAAAEAVRRQVDASLYPRLSVSEGYAASNNPVQGFMMRLNQRNLDFGPATDFNEPGTIDNFNTRVLGSYLLYDGGRGAAARQAARLDTAAAAHALAAARSDLVFAVTRDFYTVAKARRLVETAEASVGSMESILRVAARRYEEGSALKTDVLDADVRLAEAQESLVRARNALALSETSFRNVLGADPADAVTAADASLADDGTEAGETDSSAPAPLEAPNRPEALAARASVDAAEREVRAAVGGHLPRLRAFAGYDVDSGDFDRFADSFVTGVSLELDVFDGFLTRGRIAEARAKLGAAREHLRRVELAVGMEAEQARLDVAAARARLRATDRAVEQAAESLAISKERYANGLALLAQVIDAERAAAVARERRAAAMADLHIARAALRRARGEKWEDL